MNYRLRACYFGGSLEWERLARVLEFSARRHCVGWDISIQRIPATVRPVGSSTVKFNNTHKLDWWVGQVDAAADGDCVLLIDTDTMILGPLEDAWSEDFDFGYTVKEGRFPFNAGVIFLRVSWHTRQFMRVWREENRRMFTRRDYHQPWFRKYGGMNQSALGKLLTEDAPNSVGVHVARLPCEVWNCENETWAAFDPATTRIVHLKDGLRLAALGAGDPYSMVKRSIHEAHAHFWPLVDTWRTLEQAVR